MRHPGTCTFQRSHSACTFNLLCNFAGGVPLEGCGGDIFSTCCMLYNSHNHKPLKDYRSHNLPLDQTSLDPSISNSYFSFSSQSSRYTHYEQPYLNDYNYYNVRRTRPTYFALDMPRQSRNYFKDDCK